MREASGSRRSRCSCAPSLLYFSAVQLLSWATSWTSSEPSFLAFTWDNVVMQGLSDGQRELLDAQSVTGHLLPVGSVFALLADHRQALFPAEMFADLFPSGRGRPSITADVVASVLVLQALHGLSDRQAAESVMFDLRWKAACGLAVDRAAFHPTVLTYWRRRLAASQDPNRIFNAVKSVIAKTGALTGKTRRALDSTVLDDAVATQDTITQLVAAIRRVARTVPGADVIVAARTSTHDYSKTGKPDIAWDDAQARAALIHGLVTDALAVLDAVPAPDAEPIEEDSTAGRAVALLALIAGQNVEWIPDVDDAGGGGGRWQIARKVAQDRVISTVDPETRHAHKTQHRRQEGFKGHLICEPDTGMITGAKLTQASGEGSHDAAVGAELLDADDSMTGTEQILGDSAYGTGDMLTKLEASDHTNAVKPWPIRRNVPDGFTTDDFTVDHDAGTVTCPAGNTVGFTAAKRAAVFGKLCTDCPLAALCINASQGRIVKLGIHDQLQWAHRKRWATDQPLRADYRRHRPMVERSIAWMTRGARRLRYVGVRKNDAWWQLRAAAINLRKLTQLGLTTTTTGWALT